MLHRIVDIENDKTIKLPNLDCVSEFGLWSGDYLLTYSDNINNFSDYQTKICVWDKQGKLQKQLSANLAWGAASRSFLADEIGLLPDDQQTFYAYTNAGGTSLQCPLFLQKLDNPNGKRVIDILDHSKYGHNYCADPKVVFDFKNFTFDTSAVKFKVKIDNSRPEDPVGFSDWKIAPALQL